MNAISNPQKGSVFKVIIVGILSCKSEREQYVENLVTICFQVTEKVNELLQAEAKDQGVEVEQLLIALVEGQLKSSSNRNRRKHGRIDVDLSAVARPVGDEVGTAILPGKILDLSAGGLKLQCECNEEEIANLIGVGGQVEIIFTVPEREYPVCFTCEVKHVFQEKGSELGCEFVKSSGNSLDVLKSLLG